MNRSVLLAILTTGCAASASPPSAAPPSAAPAAPPVGYPRMAPLAQYREASAAEEIALARTAAPPSISAEAAVLVLGDHGYEPAVPGKNGFTCFVERSWAAGFADAEFWNPKIRAPNCFNPEATRSELPQYRRRTEWVLAGMSKEAMQEKTRAAYASHDFERPGPGAFSFMLSKVGYVNDQASGPWYPHVMLFVPHGQASAWGAGLDGSPVLGQEGSELETTVLFIPVRRWSDGSPALPVTTQHVHSS